MANQLKLSVLALFLVSLFGLSNGYANLNCSQYFQSYTFTGKVVSINGESQVHIQYGGEKHIFNIVTKSVYDDGTVQFLRYETATSHLGHPIFAPANPHVTFYIPFSGRGKGYMEKLAPDFYNKISVEVEFK